jgi:tRNA dimethylallyltransferase
LFGILAPHESSSVAFWLHKARNIIENLQSHNKIAIICGGTGFYIRAITNGIASIPKIPEDVRRMVREEFAVLGRDRFLEKLSVLDSNMAQMLHKNDTQRILRAYEVVYFTGKSLSEWWRLSGEEPSRNIKTFFLSPDRDKLNELCRRRVQKMMCDGVADEFADFIRQYPEYNGPLRNAVGYADLERFINGDLPAAECIENIFIETRRYAKRQYTWFRNKLSGTLVLDGSSRDNDVITIHLEKIFRT